MTSSDTIWSRRTSRNIKSKMATSSVETLEELVTCNICSNQYDEEIRKPKFLQCSHTICLECFEAARQEDTVTCPYCRKRTLKDNGDDEEWVLPNNQYALEMLRLKRSGSDSMSSTVELREPAEEDVDEDGFIVEVMAECFMVAFAQAVSSREMEEETLNEAYYQSLLDNQQEQKVTVAEPPAIPYIEPAGEEVEEEQLMMALALSCTEM